MAVVSHVRVGVYNVAIVSFLKTRTDVRDAGLGDWKCGLLLANRRC